MVPEILLNYFKNKTQGVPKILSIYFKNKTQVIPEILSNYFKYESRSGQDHLEIENFLELPVAMVMKFTPAWCHTF